MTEFIMKCNGRYHTFKYQQYAPVKVLCDGITCNMLYEMRFMCYPGWMTYRYNVKNTSCMCVYPIRVDSTDIIKELYCSQYPDTVYELALRHFGLVGTKKYNTLVSILYGKPNEHIKINNFNNRPFRILWPWELQKLDTVYDCVLDLINVSGVTEHLLLSLYLTGLHRDLLMLVIGRVIMISKFKYHHNKDPIFVV